MHILVHCHSKTHFLLKECQLTLFLYLFDPVCTCVCVCVGDITQQGFEKKKARLLSPYTSSTPG